MKWGERIRQVFLTLVMIFCAGDALYWLYQALLHNNLGEFIFFGITASIAWAAHKNLQ